MPMDYAEPGADLLAFLRARRRTIMAWVILWQLCRATFWVSVAGLPLPVLGRLIGIDPWFTLGVYPVLTLVLGLALAFTQVVQVRQALRELDLACDRHDLLTSAVEFLGAVEPFRRLALRQAERWLENHAPDIRCLQRWPRETRYVLPGVLLCLSVWGLCSLHGGSAVQAAGGLHLLSLAGKPGKDPTASRPHNALLPPVISVRPPAAVAPLPPTPSPTLRDPQHPLATDPLAPTAFSPTAEPEKAAAATRDGTGSVDGSADPGLASTGQLDRTAADSDAAAGGKVGQGAGSAQGDQSEGSPPVAAAANVSPAAIGAEAHGLPRISDAASQVAAPGRNNAVPRGDPPQDSTPPVSDGANPPILPSGRQQHAGRQGAQHSGGQQAGGQQAGGQQAGGQQAGGQQAGGQQAGGQQPGGQQAGGQQAGGQQAGGQQAGGQQAGGQQAGGQQAGGQQAGGQQAGGQQAGGQQAGGQQAGGQSGRSQQPSGIGQNGALVQSGNGQQPAADGLPDGTGLGQPSGTANSAFPDPMALSQNGSQANGAGQSGNPGQGSSPGSDSGMAVQGNSNANGAPGGGRGVGHVAGGGGTAVNSNGLITRIQAPRVGQSAGSTEVHQVRAPQDHAPRGTGATAAGAYEAVELNKDELEALPPKRRAVILRYFQALREASTPSPIEKGTEP